MMKKIILAFLGLSFAFAVTSCDDQIQKKPKNAKQRCTGEKQEKHHEKW